MSYQYRRDKRIIAHKILEFLSQNTLKENTFRDIAEMTGFYQRKVFRYIKFQELYEKFKTIAEFDFFVQAIRLLIDNNHVDELGRDLSKSLGSRTYGCTNLGEDAYHEGYYLLQNKRDYLEMWELRLKWLIPILALLIALASLCVSIWTVYKTETKVPVKVEPSYFKQLPKPITFETQKN